ncbi:uncharacterized protein PGTG_20356, partial [Puccinia graminis f. sp. tritici CRL 75-36-700-3]
MSDYVPTDSESERETRDNSPDPPHNRPSPSQVRPVQSVDQPDELAASLPMESHPAAASRRAARIAAATTQPVRPVRAALVPTGAPQRQDQRSVLNSQTAVDQDAVVDEDTVRVTAFTGFPDGIIDMAHLDEPLDDEFVRELEGVFELRRGYAHVGEALAYVAPPRQYAVHLYSQLAILQAIEQSRNEILAGPRAPATTVVTPANQARTFQYSPVFKDFVKRQTRELLMTKNLKVYGSDVPRGSPATLKSLLVLVLDHINGQPASFKQDYLPRGYADGDPGAVASVDSLVRSKLRKSQGMMRDLLLTNIQAPTGREITHPIPTISALMIDMRTSMTPPLANSTAVGAAVTQEARGHQTHLKARLAYLRILTIIHLVARGPREASRQWRNIDEHLRRLDAMGRDYRTAFFRLVLRVDRALFNGEQFFVGIDTSTIKLPTEQEVEGLMAT